MGPCTGPLRSAEPARLCLGYPAFAKRRLVEVEGGLGSAASVLAVAFAAAGGEARPGRTPRVIQEK